MKQNLKEVMHNSNIFLYADHILLSIGPILKCGYYTQRDFFSEYVFRHILE